MKVLNIHKRIINQSREKISELFETLGAKNDEMWPFEKWPRMKFDEGLKEGSRGGHGPIRYVVSTYKPGEFVEFIFTAPKGFKGIHHFEITKLTSDKTELKHVIDMTTTGIATITWAIAIRWLHDALVEDAFDKVENRFSKKIKKTPWNFWVRFLRKILS